MQFSCVAIWICGGMVVSDSPTEDEFDQFSRDFLDRGNMMFDWIELKTLLWNSHTEETCGLLIDSHLKRAAAVKNVLMGLMASDFHKDFKQSKSMGSKVVVTFALPTRTPLIRMLLELLKHLLLLPAMMSTIEWVKDFLSTFITKVSSTGRTCHVKTSTNTLHSNTTTGTRLSIFHQPGHNTHIFRYSTRIIADPWIHLLTFLFHLVTCS